MFHCFNVLKKWKPLVSQKGPLYPTDKAVDAFLPKLIFVPITLLQVRRLKNLMMPHSLMMV